MKLWRRIVGGQTTAGLERAIDELRLQIGSLQARQVRTMPPAHINDAEFRVFSQFGEDGIIQYLLGKVEPLPDTFVEIGVGAYTEANTLFLLQHDNWRGLIIDRASDAEDSVKRRAIGWRHDLTAITALVDRDNVNELLERSGATGPIGLLSIDIDGNDYWIWDALTVVDPAIVIVEYNSVFGARRAVTVPYDPNFDRTAAHYSNLYWGCSLRALCHLAAGKQYVLVGSNSAGNNAFFVRDGMQRDVRVATPDEAYVTSRFRESRDRDGRLSFVGGLDRLRAIAHLPLFDVETEKELVVGDLIET